MHTGIRIVVVDDHPLFVRGLELLLPQVSGGRVTIAGTTGDASAAAGLVRRTFPDLALVDLHMPPPGGFAAIAAIRRDQPRVRIVALSGDDEARAMDALRAGADGFLSKGTEAGDLLHPLVAVLDGWAVLPTGLLAALLAPARATPAAPNLSGAESRLLRLIGTGSTTTQIALELHVSERTVKRLTAVLLRKLRVTSRTEAAAVAGSAGLV